MAFELDISDVVRGLIRIADFPDLARGPIREAVREAAAAVEATARATISRQGPPRSQPFHPPAADKGVWVTTLRIRQLPSRKAGGERAYTFAGVTQGPAFYAFMLESGTRKMRPRPFMVPAAAANAANFVAKVEAAIEQAAGQTNR